MQRLEVSGAVRPIYGSLGVKRLINLQLLGGDWWAECWNTSCSAMYGDDFIMPLALVHLRTWMHFRVL